jgi:hypothetical protein
MTGKTLFMMRNSTRRSLIDTHLFYVEQARQRLLSQFDGIEADAEEAVVEYKKKNIVQFDADYHNPSGFHEAAREHGYEFYRLLSEMLVQTQLSVVAGMFHNWDKQLRIWLIREIQFRHKGETVSKKIWSANFGQIAELLEGIGLSDSNGSYLGTLDACRLVVNVYKHGDGGSLSDLKQKYPEYLVDPLKYYPGELAAILSEGRELDHTHLHVSGGQFQAFCDAIVAFWQGVPERIDAPDVVSFPNWLKKAIRTDQLDQEQNT